MGRDAIVRITGGPIVPKTNVYFRGVIRRGGTAIYISRDVRCHDVDEGFRKKDGGSGI